MKKYLLITGGAGFVGSNLIKYLVDNTNYSIISLDDYSTGKIKNHIKSRRVKYIKGNTKNISFILKKYKKAISTVFILVNLQEFIKVF